MNFEIQKNICIAHILLSSKKKLQSAEFLQNHIHVN